TSGEPEHAYWCFLPHQGNTKHGVKSADFLKWAERVFRIGRGIDDMNRAKFQQNAPDQTSTSRFEPQLSLFILVSSRQPVSRIDLKKSFISWTSNSRQIGLTQSSGRLDECIEHGLQIEGRAADDLEYVGGRGLLLQRFAQLAEQARVLDGDDCLGGEVLHQFDLLVRERHNLLAGDWDRTGQLGVLWHRGREHPALSRGTATRANKPR